jgi:cobyrinic acid a,c-diamide synthase
MSSRYWVVGGEYTDTAFRQVVEGTTEERLGPYDTYKAAHDAWQSRAWATVDNAHKRYRIVEEAGAAVAPHKRYWVVGGDYVDTGFRTLVAGTSEERHGPFETYKAAHDDWQARAWSTVDSATKRYRIVEETTV